MSSNLVGSKINGYEIIRVLGRGGMGVVYKANEVSLQRVVALKVLPGHLADNHEFLERFYREARAAARLNHPNVVTIHRVGEDDGYHYIAMEFLKGREITDLIKERGKIESAEALVTVQQVASALQAAHDLGILHRDIKPQNIMIDEGGRVKVMDFGIAKMSDAAGGGSSSLTMTGQLLGTPAYMSPEQCKGVSSDHRSDIYSLGIVLFQMLAGRVPFSGETPLAVIRKIVEEPIPLDDLELPEPVQRILQKSLAKEMEDRYQTAAEFEADIRRYLTGQEVQAPAYAPFDAEGATMVGGGVTPIGMRTTSMNTRSMGPAKKSPAGIIIAALLIGCVAVGALFLMRKGILPGPWKKPAGANVAQGGEPSQALVVPEGGGKPANGAEVAVVNTPEAIPTPSPVPNREPVAKLKISADKIKADETAMLAFEYSDPDKDTLDLAISIDSDNRWKAVNQDRMELASLAVGNHDIYFRVRDPKGAESVDKLTLTVEATPVPVKSPKPSPEPTVRVVEKIVEKIVERPVEKPVEKPVEVAMAKTPQKTPMLETAPPAGGESHAASAEGQLFVVGQQTQNVRAVAYSPDGKTVVSGGEDATAIIWDLKTQKQVAQLTGHKGPISSVAYSKDGSHILTGSADATVSVWSSSGKMLQKFLNHPKEFNGLPNAIIAVGFAPDGKLAYSASQDGTVCRWEFATTSEIGRQVIGGGGVGAVAFSPDGKTAVAANSSDKALNVWDLQSGANVRKMDVSSIKRPRATMALSVSRNGKYAVSGGQDKSIRLWEMGTGRLVRTLQGHEDWVYALDFSPDSRFIISGGKDNIVRIWDVESGEKTAEYRNHTGSVFGVAFSPDSQKAVSGGGDMSVRLFGVPN